MLTKNDLSQIKTAVQEAIKPEIKALDTQIRTLKETMATKDDIRNMATKDDIRNMATKDDIRNMATKDDLKNLESRIMEKINEAQMEIIETVDKHKADKEDVKILEKRVERLEDNSGLPPHLG